MASKRKSKPAEPVLEAAQVEPGIEETKPPAPDVAAGKPAARKRKKAKAAEPELEAAVEIALQDAIQADAEPHTAQSADAGGTVAEPAAQTEAEPAAKEQPSASGLKMGDEQLPAEEAEPDVEPAAPVVAEFSKAEAHEPEHEDAPPPKLERLQKILAQAGVASRRHAEELIAGGRVQVNGQVVTILGSKADPARDHIRVDGKLIHGAERLRYFVLNKPKGFVTTASDPEGRPTVMQFFSKMGERLYPVGRLDYLSEGLLLVTNDGELANQLTRASSHVEKTYLVKTSGRPTEEQLDVLRQGVAIDRGRPGEGKVHTAPARIRQVREGENPWFEVVVIEGRNRELRKMFGEIGHFVEKIRRIGYGPLVLDVEPGQLRELEPGEVNVLRLAAEGKLKPRKTHALSLLPREAGTRADEHGKRRFGSKPPRRERQGFERGPDRRGDRPPRAQDRREGDSRPTRSGATFDRRGTGAGDGQQARRDQRGGDERRGRFADKEDRSRGRWKPFVQAEQPAREPGGRQQPKGRFGKPGFAGRPPRDREERPFAGGDRTRKPFERFDKGGGESREFRPRPEQGGGQGGGQSRGPGLRPGLRTGLRTGSGGPARGAGRPGGKPFGKRPPGRGFRPGGESGGGKEFRPKAGFRPQEGSGAKGAGFSRPADRGKPFSKPFGGKPSGSGKPFSGGKPSGSSKPFGGGKPSGVRRDRPSSGFGAGSNPLHRSDRQRADRKGSSSKGRGRGGKKP